MMSKYKKGLQSSLQRVALSCTIIWLSLPIWSQIQKSGIVTDVHGDPLVGVSVVEPKPMLRVAIR